VACIRPRLRRCFHTRSPKLPRSSARSQNRHRVPNTLSCSSRTTVCILLLLLLVSALETSHSGLHFVDRNGKRGSHTVAQLLSYRLPIAATHDIDIEDAEGRVYIANQGNYCMCTYSGPAFVRTGPLRPRFPNHIRIVEMLLRGRRCRLTTCAARERRWRILLHPRSRYYWKEVWSDHHRAKNCRGCNSCSETTRSLSEEQRPPWTQAYLRPSAICSDLTTA